MNIASSGELSEDRSSDWGNKELIQPSNLSVAIYILIQGFAKLLEIHNNYFLFLYKSSRFDFEINTKLLY